MTRRHGDLRRTPARHAGFRQQSVQKSAKRWTGRTFIGQCMHHHRSRTIMGPPNSQQRRARTTRKLRPLSPVRIGRAQLLPGTSRLGIRGQYPRQVPAIAGKLLEADTRPWKVFQIAGPEQIPGDGQPGSAPMEEPRRGGLLLVCDGRKDPLEQVLLAATAGG